MPRKSRRKGGWELEDDKRPGGGWALADRDEVKHTKTLADIAPRFRPGVLAAMDALEELLGSGPVPTPTIRQMALSEGISGAALGRAAKFLGVRKSKIGKDTVWELPSRD